MRGSSVTCHNAKWPWRQLSGRRRKSLFHRRLHSESLENRHLLAVITVDTLIDETDGSIADGDISLRDAIAVAADGDTIDFDASLDGGTILLTLSHLAITRSMTVDATALSQGLTIDASGNDPTPDEDNGDGSRIFDIDDGDVFTDSPITLSGLTLMGGDEIYHGGAIRTLESMTLTDSTISGNSAGGIGGGIVGYNAGTFGDLSLTMTITSSTISGNSSQSGGGISSGFGRPFDNLTVTSSIISDNVAGTGGGIEGSDMTVMSSIISGNVADGPGGGIKGGDVTVVASTISGNSAFGPGGGIDGGDVTVTSSTITGNSAGRNGGGVHGFGVTITASTLSNNSATGGGGVSAIADITVTSSTISGNSSIGDGGGISARLGVGGITVTSSTISGNSAGGSGGGIHGRHVTLESSTVSGNLAEGTGGGIHTFLAGSEINLRNSLVAANMSGGDGPDFDAGVFSNLTAKYSLIGDNSGSALSEAPVGMPDANGNLVGDPNGLGAIDPLLSPLGNFGGETQTHALLPGSPAINAGDPDFVVPPEADQRSAPFVRVSDGRIDMGSFESQIAPVDFHEDGQLGCSDVDAMVAAIVAGENPTEFDLTNDTLVDVADLDAWLYLAGLENLPSHEAYPPGDARRGRKGRRRSI